jgi:hypothetical protein
MKYKVVLILVFFTQITQARVKELSLEARRIKSLRHPYYPNKSDWYGYMGLNWDYYFNISKNIEFFHNNTTFYYGDKSQVRSIGWEYELGIKIHRVEIFWHHLSEHAADSNKDDIGHEGKFPLEDSLTFRINLMNKKD